MPDRRLRLPAWIALVAMLALALLPTVSHALAFARGGAAWAEVCTPQGMKVVAVDAAQAGGEPVLAAGHLEHCPLCALAADHAAPPPAAPVVLALPAGRMLMPAAFLHAPRTLFAWRSAQPRGPPSIS